MATQTEAKLDVLGGMREFLEAYQAPTPKHDRARGHFLRLVNKQMINANKALDVYFAGLENRRKAEPKQDTEKE